MAGVRCRFVIAGAAPVKEQADRLVAGALAYRTPKTRKVRYASSFPVLGQLMFDTATTALLRAVLDEVCESVSHREIGARTHVAAKILEAASKGEISPETLRQVGREALSRAPTMWR